MCFELFVLPFSFPSRGCESGRLLSSISVLVTNTNNLGLLRAGFLGLVFFFFFFSPSANQASSPAFFLIVVGEGAYLCRSELNSSPLLSWTVCLGTASRS